MLSGRVSLETVLTLFARNRNEGDMVSLGANTGLFGKCFWKLLKVSCDAAIN